MRLLLVVEVFPPVRTSAAVQMRDLANTLARLGHHCAVLTPDSRVTEPFTMQTEGAVSVLRVRSGALKRINLVRRAINEILLSGRMWTGYRLSPLSAQGWDGIVFYSPTIFFGEFVAKLKSLHDCPAYLVLRDVFPDWAVDLGVMRKGPHYWLFKRYAQYQYSVANVIGIESPSNRRYFYPKDRRIEVLPNWIDSESDPPPDNSIPTSLEGKAILCYAGNIGVAQDIDNLIRLAQSLSFRTDCKLLFVGDGTDRQRAEAEVARLRLRNVLFLPEVDPHALRGLLRQCDIGLISLDRRLKSHNIPGKFLSYLEAGLPVLASINQGNDLNSLIEDAGVGIVLSNGDDQGLAKAAGLLLDDGDARARISEAAKTRCRSMFSSDAVAQQIVNSLAARPRE